VNSKPFAEPNRSDLVGRPNIARFYDCWLGGKDNHAADCAEAKRLLEIDQRLQQLARDNRLFQANAVTWLARQFIGQFLGIRSGLPTAENTHQAAQKVDQTWVVCADNDPVVAPQARTLLTGASSKG
jgi:hypothetical protein